MEVLAAYKHLNKTLSTNSGSFYSSGDNIALGVGKIYNNIRYPIYDEDEHIFNTQAGLVFVLTHECDVDSRNNRLFNTDVLISPIIDFSCFIEEQSKISDEHYLKNFLTSLSKDSISRVMYIPSIDKNYLPYGGLLYLNHICSTHISAFTLENAEAIAAVTAPALEKVDRFLHNHFLRPKSDTLALTFL